MRSQKATAIGLAALVFALGVTLAAVATAGAGRSAAFPTPVNGLWPFVDVSSGSGTPGVPDNMKGLQVTVAAAGATYYQGVISTEPNWDCHPKGFVLFRLESGPVDKYGFYPATLYRSSRASSSAPCTDPGPLTAEWRIIEASRTNPADPNGPSLKVYELQVTFFGGDISWNFDRPKPATTTAATTTKPATTTTATKPSPGGGKDTTAPRITALPASGRAGSDVRLSFRLSDDSGTAKDSLVIYDGSKVAARSTGSFHSVSTGSTYYWTFHSPASWRRRAGLRFCVRSADKAGNTSNWSCAAITLR